MHFIRSKKLKVFMLTALMAVVFATCSFAAKVTATTAVNVHKSAKASSAVLTVMEKGMTRTVLKTTSSGKWCKLKVNGVSGYVSAKYLTEAAEGGSARDDSSVNTNEGNANGSVSTNGAKLVAGAKKYLGYRYVYGTAGPSTFDCSGLTSYVYKQVLGKSIPRSSKEQYTKSTKVAKADLQPGDLVFFNCSGSGVSHVGMYIGGNQFIHAANKDKGVIISSMVKGGSWDGGYYQARYVGAGRYH